MQITGQVAEDFSDEEILTNPTWAGHIDDFKISYSSAIPSSYRPGLQLNSDGDGQSALYFDVKMNDRTEWNIWTKLSFNTSVNNFLKVYLLSGSSQISDSAGGVYLQFGGLDDSLYLFHREDGIDKILFTGKTIFTGNSTNSILVRVLYDSGDWDVYAGYGDYPVLDHQGSAHSPVKTFNGVFGILCNYSSSNSSKFYFDNILIQDYEKDTVPPVVEKIHVMDHNTIRVSFNEVPDPGSATNTVNYEIHEGGFVPSGIELSNDDLTSVTLEFEEDFIRDQHYTLITEGIKDISGNISHSTDFMFFFHLVQPFDIVINEIMPDPSPPQGLPEFEYLEIFNASLYPVNLNRLSLQIGEAAHQPLSGTLQQGEYVIICHNNAVSFFTNYGKTIGLPTLTLSNQGQQLTITNDQQKTISIVEYSPDWYGGGSGSDGGWALEQIDPLAPCTGKYNWRQSVDLSGGTPGRLNSVDRTNHLSLSIEKVCVTGNNEIIVFFNQFMDSSSIVKKSLFRISPPGWTPERIIPVAPDFSSAILEFKESPQRGIVYELSVTDTLCNCTLHCEHHIPPVNFGIPEEVATGDVIVNEILFNPLGDGYDYVELYNRSDKILDLSDLILGSIIDNPPVPPDTNDANISSSCCPVLPGEFRLITKSTDGVLKQYYSENENSFLELKSLPAYGNEQGTVYLKDKKQRIVDMVDYFEDMHFPLLVSVDGVALEKIHFDLSGGARENWKSASYSCGYGTPGYKNSQFTMPVESPEILGLSAAVFSPNGDGRNDLMGFTVKPGSAENTGTIIIFSLSGQPVRYIINNELLGAEEFYAWDGTDKSGHLQPAGIYIILVKIFDRSGKVKSEKLPFALMR